MLHFCLQVGMGVALLQKPVLRPILPYGIYMYFCEFKHAIILAGENVFNVLLLDY